MSRLLINHYYRELEDKIRFGGSRNEQSIRVAFGNLLNNYCKSRDFILVDELHFQTKLGTKIRLDGIIKDALRLDWEYWEAKDEKDSLDAEIEAKISKGYPTDNILFEDSNTAVLIQNGIESLRIDMKNSEDLDKIINQFLDFERAEVKDFRQAITSFNQDLPTIIETLRNLINQQSPSSLTPLPEGNFPSPLTPLPQGNKAFILARDNFLKVCQESINPNINIDDIREMIIQHILTEDIFTNIFNESQFHQENNIARQLQSVIKTFFTGNVKRNTLKTIESYYRVIIRTASSIVNHQEKQKFLKVVYENFYKAYNPKAADRLGIVYTPNEIVKFMVESTDFLLYKHFNKLLGDKGVEILDPATGTGTFITEILAYLSKNDLEYKYLNEIHCNEVSILPYYIANLNIEYFYQQKMEKYLEFNNICLVDTLDHTDKGEKQTDLFSMSQENTERIKRQNERKISVIIGNPPYNAKQDNFNDNNANRYYTNIDKRIKDTYIKEGTAQNQIVVYDMYTRFIRWATDRLNDDGIIAFISNSSFIDALAFDGFRKIIAEEFNEIWIINTKGNARNSGERRRQEGGNIFSDLIKVGVAVYFLIKNNKKEDFRIYYHGLDDYLKADEKKQFFNQNKLENIDFKNLIPDKKHNWVNQTDNDFDELLPLIDKEVKNGKSEEAIFKLFSSGLKTQRDEWVYDINQENLEAKVKFLIEVYQQTLQDSNYKDKDKIKWDRELTKYLDRKIEKAFNNKQIIKSNYRPFYSQFFYFDKHFNGMTYQWFNIYNSDDLDNKIIILPGLASPKDFHCLISQNIIDMNCLPAGCQCLSLYCYENGVRIDNITDYALDKFRAYYSPRPLGEGLGVRENPPLGEGLGVREDSLVEEELKIKDKIPEELLQRARELRKKQTSAEEIIWQCLRNRKLSDAKFRRQHNIGQYIVDFYCHSAKLVIEIDGEIHNLPEQKQRDLDREEWLKSQNLKVIRFTNDEVFNYLEMVLSSINDALPSPPALLPSARGEIQKIDIFYYVYGVLHNPKYRQKYELNLKREFPRIPFYNDFWQWSKWGKELMKLHLNYETIKPYKLTRIDIPLNNPEATPKPKLKADKINGKIIIDEVTTLEKIPSEAWEYKLGNRSALEWILDQYKEKKSKDNTIAEKFNNYQFADYKEEVINLLMGVCQVSVETINIIKKMETII